MALPLKSGAFAVVFVGTGGTGMWLLIYMSMPEWAPLSKDTDFSSAGYKDKYGDKYKHFLVGVSADNSLKINNNHWWKWSYDKQYLADKKQGSSHTAKGDFATGIDSYEKLKEKCKEVYKVEESKVKTADSYSSGEFPKEDVWRYCSVQPSSPKTISDTSKTYGSGKFGEENKTKLVAAEDANDNKWFWEIKAKEFFLSSTNPISGDSNTEFKDLYKSEDIDKANLIRNACKKVYEKDKANIDSYKTDIYKWCSFKGEE